MKATPSPRPPQSQIWLKAILLLLLLANCRGKSDELRLESKNFEQEIAQEQNLVFTFDKDLVGDSLLNLWDTTAYLQIRPQVAGKYKWTAPNELVFSPDKPFAPTTDYQVELSENLLMHSPTKYKIPAGQGITFHTPYLKLQRAKGYWVANENNPSQLEASLLLDFNYPVLFQELREHLKVYAGNKELPIELTSGNRDNIIIRVKNVDQQEQKEIPLRLHIAKGLSPAGSSTQTRQAIEKEVLLPSRQRMQVMEVSTALEEGQERIYVLTTQPITNSSLGELISISPRREFTVERLQNGLVLKGNFDQSRNYTLTLSGDLMGMEGKPMGQSYKHTLSFADVQPGVKFVNTNSIYLSSQGARNIALNITKVPRIKVSISKVYENNILHYLREGKMYDGYYDEETEEYYSNSYYDVNENNGNSLFEREYSTESLRKQGGNYLLNLNLHDLDFDSQFKGLYVITVESTDKNWLKDSKIVSVSDIGLIAKQGQNEVVVFANSIREATTMEGVEIRFISTNNQVVHKATTDKDGVARFSNINKTAPEFKVGMITARKGDDFNYMPYTQTQVNTSRFEVGGKRLSELNYDAFIYGDRDLYRPGDTIHVNTIVRTPDWQTVSGLPLK